MPRTAIDGQIRARVESFVDDLTGLIRASALEAVREALGTGGKAAAAAPAPRRTARAARPASGGKRIRRSSGEVERLAGLIESHVKANPGQRLGEIAAAVGVPTKDARRPAFSLVESGVLRTEGQRGGTRYFPGGGGGGGSRTKTTKRRTTKKRATRKRAKK